MTASPTHSGPQVQHLFRNSCTEYLNTFETSADVHERLLHMQIVLSGAGCHTPALLCFICFNALSVNSKKDYCIAGKE